jgi:hypothetical protein
LLDRIADEFLIWWPKGACFFVSRDTVTYRVHERDARGVLFLQLEAKGPQLVQPQLQPLRDGQRVRPAPRFLLQ